MRIGIIGDMHLGVKAGNQDFLDFQFFWLEEALKRMQICGIKTIIQTGDMFDVRAYTKTNVLFYVLTKLKPMLKKYGIVRWLVYAGNHDLYYRDSNEMSALEVLNHLSDDDIKFVVAIDEVYSFDVVSAKKTVKVSLVPWLNKNNQDRLLGSIPADTNYVFGHFEMVGMPMVPGGAVCEHGLEIPSFKKYTRVISGHFHTVSQHLNCTMVGTPYHLNWGDTIDGTNRGFWVLDTVTDQLLLMENYEFMTLFSVITYDPEIKYDEKYFESYAGTLVKVLVKEKPDAKHYKKFIELVGKASLIDFKIIDTTVVQIEKVQISEEVLSLDTLSAMNAFIDGQGDEFEKDNVKNLAKTIYMEAISGGQ